MKNLKTTIAYSTVAAAALLAACSKGDDVSCGAGTELAGDECVASVLDDGMGGAGDGDVEILFEDVSPERREDAQATVDQFEGAIAAAPASNTIALVVWAPVDVFGVEYNVYASTSDDNFSYGTPQATAGEGTSSILIPGLERNGEYFFVVRPVIDGVELVDDDVVVSTTLRNDKDAPSFTGAKNARPVDGSQIRVTWDAGNDGSNGTPEEALQYFVYIGETSDTINLLTEHYVSAPGATSATFSVPLPDTEYAVIVRARDSAGNFDDNEDFVLGDSGPDVEAPTFGGCEVASPRNASSLTVNWTPAVDDIATEDEMVYNLYASPEPDGHNFKQPAATVIGGSDGIVPDLEADVTYYIVCRAADPSGNEEENDRIQFATTKDDDVPPVFGGIASVENIWSDTFDLTWNAATDNQSLPEDITYRVFVSDTEDGHDFEADTPVAEVVGVTATTVQDMTSRTDYYVVVLAYDDADNPSVAVPATLVTTLVSLRSDIEIPIFSNKCATTGCHSGDTPATGLTLSPGFSFLNMVNVTPQSAAGIASTFDRVEPGEPTESHLYYRIIGATQGDQMPLSGDVLSPAEISTIEQWITEGALNN